MKKGVVPTLLIVFLFSVHPVLAGTVTRSFSDTSVNQGGQVTVSLDVDVDEASGETFYALDEAYPSGWILISDGGLNASHAYHLKEAVIQGAVDAQYQYILQAPNQEGVFTWSGIYMFENMSSEQGISGQDQVTVTSPSSSENGPGGGFCAEDHTRSCSVTQVGSCAEGNETCHSNQWSGCPQPINEVCNGIDDDCDGEVDDDCVSDYCAEGLINSTERCLCGDDSRTSGYCCDGLWYEDGCPFQWSIVMIAGIVMLIGLLFFLVFRVL